MVKKKDIEEKEEKPEPKEPEGKTPEGKEPEKTPEGKPEGFDELMNKSFAEVTAIAEEKGLNAKDYFTIDELAKAILEK